VSEHVYQNAPLPEDFCIVADAQDVARAGFARFDRHAGTNLAATVRYPIAFSARRSTRRFSCGGWKIARSAV